jgi:hypothetical protein
VDYVSIALLKFEARKQKKPRYLNYYVTIMIAI